MSELWIRISVTPLLFLLCCQDLREKQLETRLLCLLALCGPGADALTGEPEAARLLSLLPGFLLLAVSVLSGEALGEGDALLFVSLGFSLEMSRLLRLCTESFLLAGIAGLAIWVRMRGTGERAGEIRMPFLPFLTAAWCLELFL
ncbi:MAG: prepilin peptidase [Lachnospiraceae bacterium]|nr:prepilin peptidase [Lachnospiraceae bacterium]MCD8125619.1 prepilin peptidase [Lachnospiraceae bacterium]